MAIIERIIGIIWMMIVAIILAMAVGIWVSVVATIAIIVGISVLWNKLFS
jgi:uncharacterized membrane protein